MTATQEAKTMCDNTPAPDTGPTPTPSHYRLTEPQGHRLDEVRATLALLADLAVSIAPHHYRIDISVESLACVLGALHERLPNPHDEMDYIPQQHLEDMP